MWPVPVCSGHGTAPESINRYATGDPGRYVCPGASCKPIVCCLHVKKMCACVYANTLAQTNTFLNDSFMMRL